VTTEKGRQKIEGPIVVVWGGSFRLAPALKQRQAKNGEKCMCCTIIIVIIITKFQFAYYTKNIGALHCHRAVKV